MNVPRPRIVANLVTGFLGAGKTSLINRLLSQPDLADTAVIVNEFGEIGIDHLLVESVDDDIVLLKSGCICCTIRGDLREAVLALFDKRRRGIVGPFTRLVIETTGLADPVPIVATLSADPMLGYHFAMGNVVTVVDVPGGRHNMATYAESARQVAVADRVVVSKADLASAGDLAALRADIAAINATAEIVMCGEGDAAAGALLTDGIHDPALPPAQVRRWIAADGPGDHHAAHDVNRHGAIRAASIAADRPLDWPRFSLWLTMLIQRHGARILRFKAVLDVAGADSPVVVHGVQHLIHKPFHLAAWPFDERRSAIVVISDGPLDGLQRSFDAFNGCARRS